jgi:hypothetical protein
MDVEKFESSGPDVEKEFGVVRFSYNLSQLLQLAECFKENNFFIARTYVVASSFIWPNGDAESIVELIESLDHLRRGEPIGARFYNDEEWIGKLKEILCLTHPQ